MSGFDRINALIGIGGIMKRLWLSLLFIALSAGLLPMSLAEAATMVPITACIDCHGADPSLNQAPFESTQRNNPAGSIIGSHSYHVNTQGLICANCHVVPTALDHRNGKIEMAASMSGGVTYSAAVAGIVTQDNQLNTTGLGTCTGTSCHSTGSPTWGTASPCNGCHGYPPVTTVSDPDNKHATGATPVNHIGTGVTVNTKATFVSQHGGCQICHGTQSTTDGTGTTHDPHANYIVNTQHATGSINMNGPTTAPAATSTQYDSVTRGCNAACHANDATHRLTASNKPLAYGEYGGGGDCISCHSQIQTGTHGTPRDAVQTEFGLAYGHKKTGRGAVTVADCIVCHLEGKYSGAVGSSVVTTAYHKDGNIDLRDPDGAGETPITDLAGAAFTFTKFSLNLTTRTSTVANNSIPDVISRKFCAACHDNNGATNPTARSNNSGTGTAAMPFGGIALGATYTAANGAIGTQGLVDVKTQFTTTNSSYHPVLGNLNRDFPLSTRLAVPYNGQVAGRVAAGAVKTLSVIINCFDCHNAGTALTTRSVSAHGNAAWLRGTVYAAQPTLCTTCHTGYTNASTHATGSAWSVTGSSHNAAQNCHYCHGSNTSTTRPARPLGAQDYHGNNALVGGGLWPTVNSRPYAFIRGWSGTSYHRPFRSTEFTTGSATCGTGTCPGGQTVGDGANRTYTPGGSY